MKGIDEYTLPGVVLAIVMVSLVCGALSIVRLP